MEIHDFVHGVIVIPDVIKKIIDTPHFQRLKHLKQLGLTYKSLPVANYTRYEHSIGTFHLTSIMLKKLEENSNWIARFDGDPKELERYKLYRLAVQIAALLHDIGHGPFSHLWEDVVPGYQHECVAKECIDDIFDNLGPDVLPKFRANNNYVIEVIKALILGDFENLTPPFPAQYRYLFEIVHNKQCELDVDKLDYLKRDHCFAKLICKNFSDLGNQLDCIFFEARIGQQGLHIEYRYEDFKKIYALYEARARLHVHFYNLPRTVANEYMLNQIIRTGNFKIDNIPITEIRSRPMKTFLKFVDEEILQIVKGHELYTYFQDDADLVEFIEDDYVDSKDDNIIELRVSIEGAGIVMPADSQFNFYGNPETKGAIVRDTKTTILTRRFRHKNLIKD